MPYIVNLEPGEQIIKELSLVVSPKVEAFHFAVTNQALYLPAKKLIAVKDPYYYRRVRHEEITEVAIRRLRPYVLWFFAALMFIAGLTVTILMMWPFFTAGITGRFRVSGWPVAVCIGGLLIPFAAHGRRGLIIRWAGGKFRWKPPLVIDRASKQRISETIRDIAMACKDANLDVTVNGDSKSAVGLGAALFFGVAAALWGDRFWHFLLGLFRWW